MRLSVTPEPPDPKCRLTRQARVLRRPYRLISLIGDRPA